MAAVTTCHDSGAPKIKSVTVSPSIYILANVNSAAMIVGLQISL